MKTYDLKFEQCFIQCAAFKEREARVFQNIILNSRLANEVKFHGYANITFDEENDKKHEHPHIKELEQFSRTKANAMIFEFEGYTFDRMLIYQNAFNKGSGFYGFVAYHADENPQQTHIYNITLNVNDLMWRINSFLLTKRAA